MLLKTTVMTLSWEVLEQLSQMMKGPMCRREDHTSLPSIKTSGNIQPGTTGIQRGDIQKFKPKSSRQWRVCRALHCLIRSWAGRHDFLFQKFLEDHSRINRYSKMSCLFISQWDCLIKHWTQINSAFKDACFLHASLNYA